MFEIIRAGGWIMLPILACSVIALAIILERSWALRSSRVLPPKLTEQVWQWINNNELNRNHIETLAESSPLGEVLATGLNKRHQSREIMKESLEDRGRHVAHELQKFVGILGTIAGIAPLLGLLGTVLGMITVFSVITTTGVGEPSDLAGGISQALITTAAGLVVAIPALIFYRHFRQRIDDQIMTMEAEALKLLDAFHETD